ncbi:HCP family protein with MYND-type zinc finger protein [Rhynchospora pubera]|uniref:HCP family protein with MYND-type zinc finger protein n=1 Tax=Rhynchospora pubera TaxID=906938 RepID=A0AAV8FX92_9POAL|nr:HCP family protein with MYND-type zinc finger protein [Rhynchospora pubera]
MRTSMENNRGIKRQRIAIVPLSDLIFQEDGPRRKRICCGGGSNLTPTKNSSNVTSFDKLNDDVLISVLSKVSSSASTPSDLINILLINKKFSKLGIDGLILANASRKAMCVRAKQWCESSDKFLSRCADAGNLEACYFLGMINFHCFGNYSKGITLLEKAATGSHAEALYSQAILHFNRNVNALRELGYCFQSGFGLPPSPAAAYRLLEKANTLDLTASTSGTNLHGCHRRRRSRDFSLLTNYGYSGRTVHPANAFMVEWWWLGDKGEDGLHMCSNVLCGRRETRKNGFRRCSRCGITVYCSHACQEVHWNMEHGITCIQVENA